MGLFKRNSIDKDIQSYLFKSKEDITAKELAEIFEIGIRRITELSYLNLSEEAQRHFIKEQ